MTSLFWKCFSLAMPLIACLVSSSAWSAELYGVSMPSWIEMDGVYLRLNGIGARIVSPFGIKIYVAGLYLERPTTDAARILASPERKLIEMRFLRAIDHADIARVWSSAFADNCQGECRLPTAAIGQFNTMLRDMAIGGEMRFFFTADYVEIFMDGRRTGAVVDAGFVPLLLATWIGEAPPTLDLKADLLGIDRR